MQANGAVNDEVVGDRRMGLGTWRSLKVLGAVRDHGMLNCDKCRDDDTGACRHASDVERQKQARGHDMQLLDPGRSGTALQRHVSFYITNFPVHLSHFYLRKGFEVCGILEDVYVPKKRNMHGQPYGFVKFSNVRDIAKLEKALNAVSFG
jgi:hypothetical protein